MLLTVKSIKDLNFSALMEIYEEGNRENARDRYPDLPEAQGILQAELDFHQFLREIFFSRKGACYEIWIENGKWVSALRLEPYRDGLLLEALETAPDQRRKGYGTALIQAVTETLADTKVYSHVHKNNLPSLGLHAKCGFVRVSESAAYIDGSVNSRACTMLFRKEETQTP